MQVQLVMFKSDGSRRDFPLTRGRIVIGRTNEVGLRIPLSSVSRKHCEIAIEDGVVKMRDLGSSNGTLHNSVRVKEAVLAAGDQVEVGPVVFIVVIDGVPAEIKQVRSLVEQELVDTSVGLPAQGDDDQPASVAPGAPAAQVAVAQPTVMEPAPALPKAPKVAAAPIQPAPPVEEEEVLAEVEAEIDEDPLAAAARAAELADKKAQTKPADPFAEGPTVVDFDDDPIAALERLAAAELAQADSFSLFSGDKKGKDSKGEPKKK